MALRRLPGRESGRRVFAFGACFASALVLVGAKGAAGKRRRRTRGPSGRSEPSPEVAVEGLVRIESALGTPVHGWINAGDSKAKSGLVIVGIGPTTDLNYKTFACRGSERRPVVAALITDRRVYSAFGVRKRHLGDLLP
jgi:hypothetical protein